MEKRLKDRAEAGRLLAEKLTAYANRDEVICLLTPETFFAISMWYERFAQTTDDEVRELLDRAPAHKAASASIRT
jgi:predicted phosphoribosyltransferase